MSRKTDLAEFESWLKKPEDYVIEFKTAKNSFSDRDLMDYAGALANEGGGKLILGVNPQHKVVGTNAYQGTLYNLPQELYNKINIRVDVEELPHPNGRIIIFHVPCHFVGQLVQSKGNYRYPMRLGSSLTEMDSKTIKRILNEVDPDFSCLPVAELKLEDLDEEAIANFKKLWVEKSGRKEYLEFSTDKLLAAAGLMQGMYLNFACLILFGKKEIIDKLVPDNEIIFEWRQNADSIPHDYRMSWRKPFFKIHNEVWDTINARNLRIPLQDGLFQREILAFNEKAIREALLNAIAHRDYTIKGRSIFIKASPKEFIIESPGGLPPGVNIDNILSKTYWRNRCIAETFEKAGLVERSGQGMDDIYASTIREGKGLPDLSKSDETSVVLNIPAQIKDKSFILFLEKVQKDQNISFSFEEIYELERVREIGVIKDLGFRNRLVSLGIIEKIGKTRGARYILSHKYYSYEKKAGVYTRLAGISRDKQKEFILKHLEKYKKSKREELQDIFPELKPMDVSNLLQELKKEGKIHHKGSSKTGVWALSK